ncbi:MAG: RNA polymerase sigma factor [Verrucomicrobia bacterium]|nr:RNA polymerase sigma factor [Verrucomicrobiota bacterium]
MVREDEQPADRFLALLRPIERDLEVYCRRLVWNEHDFRDAIQNAVMRGFKAFDRYHDDTNFRAWMFKILTNETFALNRKYARAAKHEFHLDPEELAVLPAPQSASAETDWLAAPGALREALDECLVAALQTLTDTERAVLLLRAIGEFRYVDIAESLAIPLGSVMGNLSRARLKMRNALQRSQSRTAP